jgi:hypothetical protein
VTAVIGAYLITLGGAIVFGKFPSPHESQEAKNVVNLICIVGISLFGYWYQSKKE